MSARSLQHLVVRLLYDPSLAGPVFADTPLDEAAATLGVEPEELGWLRTSDPRAFRADAGRQHRTLGALFEELPASSAVALASAPLEALEGFFASVEFRDVVVDRGSLALAYAAWLGRMAWAGWPSRGRPHIRLRALAALEGAVANSRRAPPRSVAPDAVWSLSDAAVLVHALAGSVELLGFVRSRLGSGEAVLSAVLDAEARLGGVPLPRVGPARLWLLVEPGPGGPRLGEIPEPLADLLGAAEGGATAEALEQLFARHGLTAKQGAELCEELAGDGLLNRPPLHRPNHGTASR